MYLVCCSSSHIWWHNHSHLVLSQRLRRVLTWNALADAVYARDRNATVTSFRSNITTFKSASITKEMLMVSLHWDENKMFLSGSQFITFAFQSKLQFYFHDDRTLVVTLSLSHNQNLKDMDEDNTIASDWIVWWRTSHGRAPILSRLKRC